MAIRILHIVEALGVGGGVENGIANLIERMDRDRFEHVLCAVFRLGLQVERYPADRVQMVCLDQKERKLAIQVGPLAEVVRKVRPDIVHSRNWGALEAVVAGRWVGSCGVIHSEHGVEMNPAAEPRRRNWMRRAVFGLAHEVFAVSYQLRDMLASRTGIAARKIGVIHNGVDTRKFRQDSEARQQLRAELGIAEEEFLIGCVGRLNKIKDYPTLLRAVEVLSESGAPWRLVIAGCGPELGELKAFAAARPALAGRVQFLGPWDRVPELLSAMDTYVLPSLCEGISNSLLEAMASGVASIVTDTGGNPEVVEDGKSGLLFPVGDFQQLAQRLARLQGNQDLRAELGRQATRRVEEQFSLDAMVEQYEAMYGRMAMRRAAARMGVEETRPADIVRARNG
jgi:sugar transferase (PEP-CTERM/EpsH1 system associated)